jgi:hypothetical protein
LLAVLIAYANFSPAGATGTHQIATHHQQSHPPPIDADVVAIEKVRNGTHVWINRGTADGVAARYHAQLLDANGNPVPHGDFPITQVTQHACGGVSSLPLSVIQSSGLRASIAP